MKMIRFTSAQIFESGGIGKGPTFEKGSTLAVDEVAKALGQDVDDDYAEAFLHRWVQRGVADYVPFRRRPAEEPKAPAAPASVPPAPPVTGPVVQPLAPVVQSAAAPPAMKPHEAPAPVVAEKVEPPKNTQPTRTDARGRKQFGRKHAR